MTPAFELSIEISEPYDFNFASLSKISMNPWVKNQWPLVYFIQNEKQKLAYVGESTNASQRIKNHLANPERQKLNKVSIIGSDKFNKSATLDIESSLIQYISAEGTYALQNGNYGLINHNYYQQYNYKNLFKEIWTKLIEKKVVSKSITEIENSELFKYSPYKALNEDQYNSVLEILEGLTIQNASRIFVSGSAGTGKTILATYLLKLLSSDLTHTHFDEFDDNQLREIKYIKDFQAKYPKAKIGLVIAMSSLRVSLQKVFRKIPGLKGSMVISPSDTFKQHYDLLLVDEAHRLRQYRNIGWMGVFRQNNRKLLLGDEGTELDWIIANSTNQIFFYDAAQSVKPSDVSETAFAKLLADPATLKLQLKSQMRVKGGNNYIGFVDELLQANNKGLRKYSSPSYQLTFFESLHDLKKELDEREQKFGLCRLVAGYSWPWPSEEDKTAIDIVIEGLEFQWNQTTKDWIYSPNAANEVGCIHTTQGYDLNFTGVIFGREIDYNPLTGKIEIDAEQYFDNYGKKGVHDPNELKDYIINIYKTLMFRGIRGTFVYACNENLREFFKKHIETYGSYLPFKVFDLKDVKPFINSVPLVDISAAAGGFSDFQVVSDFEWIELPFNIAAREGLFVCKVVGESMNRKIPNNSYCVFKRDDGGTRNGQIVLVEMYDRQDAESGSRYTVKRYHSEKQVGEEGWAHEQILLKPLSDDADFEDIVLAGDEVNNLKVVGIFVDTI